MIGLAVPPRWPTDWKPLPAKINQVRFCPVANSAGGNCEARAHFPHEYLSLAMAVKFISQLTRCPFNGHGHFADTRHNCFLISVRFWHVRFFS